MGVENGTFTSFYTSWLLFSVELIKIADKYGEQGLKQRCEQQLKLVTTKHTVCDLYSIAVGYNNKVNFIKVNEF